MAMVSFKKGLRAGLPATYAEGTFYVTTDERAIYLDVSDSARIRLGDFQEFATLDALIANTNPSTTALYYVTDINCLAKWNGSEYVQINKDTGMTSVEVVGDGNAVTAAVYSADGRKLTLTKGATYMTAADVDGKVDAAKTEVMNYVGAIPDGYTEETIVAYINKKAEETLNSASGGSSESAASVLAALNTYKSENDPKVSDLQTRMAAAEGEIDALQAIDHDAYKTADEQVLADAKEHANGLNTAMDARMQTVEGKAHEHSNKDELDLIVAGDKAKWDKAVTDLADEIARAVAAEEANAAAAKAADDKAVAAQDSVDTLAGKVGEVPADKTVVQMIADAQSAATYDDTKVKADIAANAAAIQVEKERMDAFMTLEDGQTLNAALDSLKEIQDFITNEADDADVLLGKVSALEAIVAGIGGEGEPATVVAYVTAAIEALKIGDYAKADELAALAERVAAMEAKVPNWDAAEQNAKDHADDLNEAMDARMLAVEGKAHEHTFNEAELNKISEGDVAKWNAAQANAEATAAEALNKAKTELEGKITEEANRAKGIEGGLESRLAAVEGDYLKATDKTELEGKITAENERAVAAEEALAGRVATLEGIDHEAYKDYADQAEADAIASAQANLTAALSWSNF